MGYNVAWDNAEMIEEPKYDDAMKLSKEILTGFSNGEFGEIYLAYTAFKNTISHEPTLIKLLPYEADESETVADKQDEDDNVLMNFEPKDEEALNLIIPKYITSLIFGGMVEAAASENGARMQAMDSATSNAEEMISSLSLMYNRARQGSITQELTEIVAGANAIS
jgi:F-type H+-transporting ATPase subunit gamma